MTRPPSTNCQGLRCCSNDRRLENELARRQQGYGRRAKTQNTPLRGDQGPQAAAAAHATAALAPPELAAALAEVAAELEKAGDYPDHEACIKAIEDAGGVKFGSGGGGHLRLKHHGLQEVYEISGHTYKDKKHKQSKSRETKAFILRWWAWNLTNERMPPQWRPRQF